MRFREFSRDGFYQCCWYKNAYTVRVWEWRRTYKIFLPEVRMPWSPDQTKWLNHVNWKTDCFVTNTTTKVNYHKHILWSPKETIGFRFTNQRLTCVTSNFWKCFSKMDDKGAKEYRGSFDSSKRAGRLARLCVLYWRENAILVLVYSRFVWILLHWIYYRDVP